MRHPLWFFSLRYPNKQWRLLITLLRVCRGASREGNPFLLMTVPRPPNINSQSSVRLFAEYSLFGIVGFCEMLGGGD